jgi:hypothetical protein
MSPEDHQLFLVGTPKAREVIASSALLVAVGIPVGIGPRVGRAVRQVIEPVQDVARSNDVVPGRGPIRLSEVAGLPRLGVTVLAGLGVFSASHQRRGPFK